MKEARYATIILLGFITCFFSCTSEGKDMLVTRDKFAQTVSLKADSIDFDAPLHPLNFSVLRDSLILVLNWDGNPHFAEIYHLESKELLTTLAIKGRGPGEYLGCSVIKKEGADHDFFLLYDMIKQTVTKYHIDSLLSSESEYVPNEIVLPRYAKDVSFGLSDSLIIYNSNYFKSDNLSNKIASPVQRISVDNTYDGDGDTTLAPFFAWNVSGGYIFENSKDRLVWVANHYEDRIDIYDWNFTFIKSLAGPDQLAAKYVVSGNGDVSFDGHYYRSYYPGVCTEDFVYLIYLGANGIPNDEPYEKPVEVFKFGWDGELVTAYKLDQFIYNISISPDERYMYGTAVKRFGDYPKLVRYELK